MANTAHLQANSWRSALIWGIGAALIHRIWLMIWMALLWILQIVPGQVTLHDSPSGVPSLSGDIEHLLFGVWRRWDTLHYFDLALNGYQANNAGPTVFGVLTPLAFRISDMLLPGQIDVAAMIFTTVAFAACLVLLYRVVEIYYGDADLARWSLILTTLLPLSYFYLAPMSESLYLALVLLAFYFAHQERWLLFAISGGLATLARSQGVILAIIGPLLFVQTQPIRQWPQLAITFLRRGWVLVLIPIAFIGFQFWRTQLGLPSLNDTYLNYSYVYLTDPISGLAINFGWIFQHPQEALSNIDMWFLVLSVVMFVLMLRSPKHRQLAFVIYTLSHILLFVSKINYIRGTDIIVYSQSYGRYALALFPLIIVAADYIRQARRLWRTVFLTLILFTFLCFSALHAFGIGPA